MEEEITGHPPNAYWFCIEHLEIAKKYESLHSQEALSKIEQIRLEANGDPRGN